MTLLGRQTRRRTSERVIPGHRPAVADLSSASFLRLLRFFLVVYFSSLVDPLPSIILAFGCLPYLSSFTAFLASWLSDLSLPAWSVFYVPLYMQIIIPSCRAVRERASALLVDSMHYVFIPARMPSLVPAFV